jgi:hypothetical protein
MADEAEGKPDVIAGPEASHPSQFDRYADMPDTTITRSGLPLGVLRETIINHESRETAEQFGVSPYDVMAEGKGVVHNATTAAVNKYGFPDRASVLSAWGVPSLGAGAFQFEKEEWEDAAKGVFGPYLKDFSERSQRAVFNYIVTNNIAGKSGIGPWSANYKLGPMVRWLQKYYGVPVTAGYGILPRGRSR